MLIDSRITYWFHNRGHILGAAAVLTLDEVAGDTEPRFFHIELQVDGLDAVAGVAPLKRMSWPHREAARHLEGTWSAEGNPDSSQEWLDDDAVVQLEYDATVRLSIPTPIEWDSVLLCGWSRRNRLRSASGSTSGSSLSAASCRSRLQGQGI
jgi:hypothetical protein